MSTRYKGATVIFDRDIHEDDIELVLNAFRLIKGVGTVKPVETLSEDYWARERIRHDTQMKLYEAIKGVFEKPNA